MQERGLKVLSQTLGSGDVCDEEVGCHICRSFAIKHVLLGFTDLEDATTNCNKKSCRVNGPLQL